MVCMVCIRRRNQLLIKLRVFSATVRRALVRPGCLVVFTGVNAEKTRSNLLNEFLFCGCMTLHDNILSGNHIVVPEPHGSLQRNN